MPEGRFLSKSIAWSEQVGSVSLEADYLFMRMIPHLDSAGRMAGAPKAVRAQCCPLRGEFTPELIERCLQELVTARLVVWYRVGVDQFLEFPGFLAHQRGARLDREAPSRIPGCGDPSAEVVRRWSGDGPDQMPVNRVKSELTASEHGPDLVRVSEVKRSEEKLSNTHGSSNGDLPCTGRMLTPSRTRRRTTEYSPEFEECWSAYPHRPNHSKRDGYRAYSTRRSQGISHEDLLAGTRRYAKYCKARGIEGSEYVKHASTFYGPGEHWAQTWDLAAPALSAARAPDVAAAAEAERKHRLAIVETRRSRDDGAEWWQRMQREAPTPKPADVYEYAFRELQRAEAPAGAGR